MLSTARDRIAAATGAAFVVLIIIGNTLSVAGTSQGSHPSGAQVLKDAAHQASSASAHVGFVLEFAGLTAFLGFLGYLTFALSRRPGDGDRSRVAAGTAIVAGIVMIAIKLGSIAPSGALLMDRHHISPQLAQVLNDMNGVSFVMSWLPFAVFIAAAATALRHASLVGKPTAYLGIFIGVVGLVVSLVGLDDPVNANPMAFLLGLVWTLVVSVRLAVRPGTGSPAEDSLLVPDARVAVNA
jgi:hypothetical protein